MWFAAKEVGIGLQCWGNWKMLSVKLAATQQKCIIITLKLHKMVKVA